MHYPTGSAGVRGLQRGRHSKSEGPRPIPRVLGTGRGPGKGRFDPGRLRFRGGPAGPGPRLVIKVEERTQRRRGARERTTGTTARSCARNPAPTVAQVRRPAGPANLKFRRRSSWQGSLQAHNLRRAGGSAAQSTPSH